MVHYQNINSSNIVIAILDSRYNYCSSIFLFLCFNIISFFYISSYFFSMLPIPYNYRSSNSNSCRSVLLLKTMSKSNGNPSAIAILKIRTAGQHYFFPTNIILANCTYNQCWEVGTFSTGSRLRLPLKKGLVTSFWEPF